MFTCLHCQKNFTRLYNIRKHLKSVVGEPLYPCHLCEQKFNQEVHYKSHLLAHKNNKRKLEELQGGNQPKVKGRPYKCDMCDKEFAKLCNMKNHIMTHTGERPHICEYCPKTFTRPAHLKRHLKTHFG